MAAGTGSVLVTGGAGAIGSSLCRELVGAGREVIALDNLSSGRREHVQDLQSSGRFRLVQVDLREPEALTPHFRGASAVWHLAANPDIRRGTEDPRLDLEHGTLATFNALEAARRADISRFAFSSSSVVYGLPTVFPTPEEYGPLLPESLYGASKLASEAMVSAYAHDYGMRTLIFRFANVIGSTMTHGVLYDFFEKLRRDPMRLEVLGDGRQSKSYLRTEDCVGAMVLADAKCDRPVELFNLGTPDRTSVREIAEHVVRAAGGHARIDYTGGERGWVGDVPQQLLAIDRIRRLGWEPRWDSGAAVDKTIGELAARYGYR